MDDVTKFIIFKLLDQSFGININQVISIERVHEITDVPRTSDFIKGVTYIRSKTTPIIDLKERLLMNQAKFTNNSRILVVNIKDMQIGLIVDEATEVRDINQSFIEPAPQIIGGVKETFVEGIANLEERLLILLHLETIIDPSETNELREVVEAE